MRIPDFALWWDQFAAAPERRRGTVEPDTDLPSDIDAHAGKPTKRPRARDLPPGDRVVRPRLQRLPDAGLSLIEVMAVLAIIGVASGTAVLTIYGGRVGADAESEARRLAGRLQLAADESLLTGTTRRLDWDVSGYRFLTWNPADGAWRPDEMAVLPERHELAEGLTLAGPDGSRSVLITPDAANHGSYVIFGDATVWTVSFDGLKADAKPGDGE